LAPVVLDLVGDLLELVLAAGPEHDLRTPPGEQLRGLTDTR
jgi:hypothetical protein